MEPAAQGEAEKNIGKIRNIFRFVSSVGWFVSAYIALAAFVLVKNFAFDVVRANSRDMQNTFTYGDPVLVQKSFHNLITNDIVYFKHPVPDSVMTETRMMQRVFGIPGDSLQIVDKSVYINRVKIEDTSSIKHNYYIKAVQKLDSTFKAEFNLTEGGEISEAFDYSFSLSAHEAAALRAHPYIVSVDVKGEKKGAYDESCFPFDAAFPWNADHFGPIYIPAMGDTLKLDSISIKLYRQIISLHEKNDLRFSGDSILINGIDSKYYVTKKNYYFVLGDNRGNANDSRNWGYLPENLVVGKVLKQLRRSR